MTYVFLPFTSIAFRKFFKNYWCRFNYKLITCSFFSRWDYRAAELGTPLNLTAKFIDFFAKYGAIYDRREATSTMVEEGIF